MKKKRILLLSLLSSFVFSHYANAQGRFDGYKTVGISYLGVTKGNGINLNYQQAVGDSYFGYRVDASWYKRDYNLTVIQNTYPTTLERYSIGSAFTYSFEDWITFPLNLQAFVGAQYGQEKLNKDKDIIDNIPYEKPRKNVFGAYIGFELEISLSTKFSLGLTAQNVFSNSDIKNSQFLYGFGFKYALND